MVPPKTERGAMTKPKKKYRRGSPKSKFADRWKSFADGVGGSEEPKLAGIGNYPSHLRGFATNRYGGNQLQSERGLKGNTYGPASAPRVYTDKEKKEYEAKLRERGDLQ